MKNLLPILQKIENISALYITTFLFFLALLVYANTLGNGLFYDDEQFIYKNVYVQTFDIGSFFTKNVDAGAGVISNYYRPLLLLVFGVQHLLVGDAPFLYHLTSILFHAGSGIVLYLLLVRIVKNKAISLTTSILFLIHPIQTEAVAYVSGMGDPMGMFFMLLSVYLSFEKMFIRKFLSVLFFIFALLSKELTIITPLIIFICHVAHSEKITKTTIIQSLKNSSIFIGINLLYIFLRLTILNFANTLNFYNGHNVYSDSILVRLYTFLSLLPQYFGLVFNPNNLFIDRNAPIIASPNSEIIIVLFICCLIGGISLYIVKKSIIPLFSFLFFFFAFIPTSGIIPINGIFFEHFFYYPSIGFFLFLSYLLYNLFTSVPKSIQALLLSLLIIIFFALSIRTIYRNAEWHDPITFYSQTIKHTQSARIYNNLAMSYADNGDSKNAISMYKNAIKLGDYYPQTHYNLGNAYIAVGNNELAEYEYRTSLKMDPFFYLSYFKLFSLYKATDQKVKQDEVIKQVAEIVKKNPSFQPVLSQLEQAE